ncbi:polysaccharide deacetylase family protein [Streptomyces sp. NPDC087422]|uniref:polysaccharide deacetylase family protein n=1 Tax=Streptomyces sp. NPDC087422 TaxID=3365786 RepID=UPI0037FE5409
MTYKTGRSGMLSRTAVRRTAAAVATAALAGTALAACGTQHGGAAASGADDARASSRAPSSTASGEASGPAAGIPSQRTSPPGDPSGSQPSGPGPGQNGPAPTGPSRTGPVPTDPSGTVPSQTVPGQPTGPLDPSAGPADPSGSPATGAPAGESIQHSTEDGGRSVALTFDDGPDPRWTPQVLALLAAHHAKATFCEIGPNAAAHPDLVRQITTAGHRLCDHSVHHNERQSSRSAAYNTHEIVDAQREITKAAGAGAKLWYYRAPGGDFTPTIRHIAAGHGLRPLGWTVDSRDWERPGTAKVLANIDRQLRPGSIVLMHDGGGDRAQTVRALSRLLDRLDAQGWTYSFPAR